MVKVREKRHKTTYYILITCDLNREIECVSLLWSYVLNVALSGKQFKTSFFLLIVLLFRDEIIQ